MITRSINHKKLPLAFADKGFWRSALQTIADRIDQFCQLVEAQ